MNQNLEVIKKRNSSLLEEIETFDESKTEKVFDIIESDHAVDGDMILYVEKNEIDYRLNSLYCPKHEAERWAKSVELDNVTNVVLMFGLGNGYFVREILNNMSQDDVCLVYEPCPELFFHVLENYDIQDILADERMHLYIEGVSSNELHLFFNDFIYVSDVISNILAYHPYYPVLFQESLKKFNEESKISATHAQINFNTYMAFSKCLVDNTFKNLQFKDEMVSLIEFRDKVSFDMPVVIVAAGPSVEESIEDLRKVKDKVIIIAVDRILDYLLERDIVPDYVATIDAHKRAERFSKRDDIEVPLFTLMNAKYEILKKQKGLKIICNMGSFFYKWFSNFAGRIAMLDTGGSVACFAYEIAVVMGSKNILLVGQDLSFKGKYTHAGSEISNPGGADDITLTEGVDGKMIESRYDWIVFKQWYEDEIKSNPDITVYDTKNRGAKIQGTISMPLTKAVEDVESKSQGSFSKTYDLDDFETIFEGDMTKALKLFLEKCNDDLDKAKKKSKEGIGYICDLIQLTKEGKLNTKKASDIIDRAKNVHVTIEQMFIYDLLDGLVTKAMQKSDYERYSKSEDLEKDSLDVFESEQIMFHEIIEATKYVKPFVEDAIARLEI